MGGANIPPTMYGSSGMSDFREGSVNSGYDVNGARYVKITKVNWFAHTVDCVGLHQEANEGPWYDVPVISTAMTQAEGVFWLPSVVESSDSTIPPGNLEGVMDAIGVIAFIANNKFRPVCIGFVPSPRHEFSFGEEGSKIERHVSGVYNRTTKTGTYEFAFPDGTYLKIGPPISGTELTPLSGQNIRDATVRPWNIPPDNPRIITVAHPSGATVRIDELGNISIISAQNLSISATSSVSITAPSGSIIINNVALESHTHRYSNENGESTTTGPQ